MPQGLAKTISLLPSPFRSATISSRLSLVLSSQPSKRLPFGLSASAAKELPLFSSVPIPHGLPIATSPRSVAIEVGGGDKGGAVDRDAPGAAPARADIDVRVAVEEGFEMREQRAREMRAERVVGARIGHQAPAVAAVERKEHAESWPAATTMSLSAGLIATSEAWG